MRSISTFGGSSCATSFFVRLRMNGASCALSLASVPSRSAVSAASNEERQPRSPGSRNRKMLQRSSWRFLSGVPVRTTLCLARTAKHVWVTLASGFLMNWPSSRTA